MQDAVPKPPFKSASVAPVPAPTLPWSTGPDCAASNALRPSAGYGFSTQSCAPPPDRSKRIAAGTIGTRWPAAGNPRPASRSPIITPSAAANPKAEPPDRTSASTCWTVAFSAKRSVSRVPGAPPIICRAATIGASQTRTVTPDFRTVSEAWPRRSPATSVIALRGPGVISKMCLVSIRLDERACETPDQPKRFVTCWKVRER